METGLSATYGFDYEMKNFNRKFKFSMAQVVKDTNDNSMPSKTSLDKRFSDVVGGANYKINDQFSLNYNYALDQNFLK